MEESIKGITESRKGMQEALARNRKRQEEDAEFHRRVKQGEEQLKQNITKLEAKLAGFEADSKTADEHTALGSMFSALMASSLWLFNDKNVKIFDPANNPVAGDVNALYEKYKSGKSSNLGAGLFRVKEVNSVTDTFSTAECFDTGKQKGVLTTITTKYLLDNCKIARYLEGVYLLYTIGLVSTGALSDEGYKNVHTQLGKAFDEKTREEAEQKSVYDARAMKLFTFEGSMDDASLKNNNYDIGDLLHSFLVSYTMLASPVVRKRLFIQAATLEIDGSNLSEQTIQRMVNAFKCDGVQQKPLIMLDSPRFIGYTEKQRSKYPLVGNGSEYAIKQIMNVQTGPLSRPSQEDVKTTTITVICNLPDVLILYKRRAQINDVRLDSYFRFRTDIAPRELLGDYAYFKNGSDEKKQYRLKSFIYDVGNQYTCCVYDDSKQGWYMMDTLYLTKTHADPMRSSQVDNIIKDDAVLFFFVESSNGKKR
jgi:hypothetical protein